MATALQRSDHPRRNAPLRRGTGAHSETTEASSERSRRAAAGSGARRPLDGNPALAGRPDLKRIHTRGFTDRRHRLKTGELHDVAPELGVFAADETPHCVISRLRLTGIEPHQFV